ncbi:MULTISPECIES: ATP-binding protein [Catenuloplanes]|uniref:Anti-sigma regulatory factor (Ser/Thr protein kinase) n=1 Tax=Catenuloplanes niger TaxID=587534 RepID=A0AAE3ZWR0_9ACTN|nr:ATP-binding protein [Catenuloplanes niger]MDR7326255.1 anti-sigma regulatory factor (Ser/Thr protein kinase) [Catenuloplanes niger]
MTAQPSHHTVRASLPPVADSSRAARHLVVDACTRWNVPAVADTACVIASELVTNAVRHAGTPMDMTLAIADGKLLLAVRDGSPRPAVPTHPDPHTPGGRGLLLVGEMSQAWGSLALPDGGKVVWAALRTDAE